MAAASTDLSQLIARGEWPAVERLLGDLPRGDLSLSTNAKHYPLHSALLHRAPYSTICLLLDAFPEALSASDRTDSAGSYPSHLSLQYRSLRLRSDPGLPTGEKLPPQETSAVASLLTPGRRRKKDTTVSPPIRAEERRRGRQDDDNDEFRILQLFLSRDPHCCSRLDSEGFLPLHIGLRSNISQASFDLLIAHNLQQLEESATSVCFVRKKSRFGQLPLHAASEHQCGESVLQVLLAQYPQASGESYQGKLPLHFLCENKHKRISLQKLEILLEGNPSAVSCRGVDAMLPLHVAIANKCPLAIVKALVELHPEALLERDTHGRLPLHYALEKHHSEDVIEFLVESNPESASYRGAGDLYPLHIAINEHFGYTVIRAVLCAYRSALHIKDMFGIYPFHNALYRKKADIDTLKLLLGSNGSLLEVVDEYGRTTLHYAISRSFPVEFIESLIRLHPKACQVTDVNQQIPLHVGVIRNVSVETIRLLLEGFPQGVGALDRHDMLPLNYAIVESNISNELIQLLLESSTAFEHSARSNHFEIDCSLRLCASVRNHWHNGKLFLHYATEFKRSFDTISLLLDYYPESAQEQEKAKGRTALHWAIERSLDTRVLLAIYRTYPAAAHLTDYEHLYPVHYCVIYRSSEAVVRALLETNPLIALEEDYIVHTEAFQAVRYDSASSSFVSNDIMTATATPFGAEMSREKLEDMDTFDAYDGNDESGFLQGETRYNTVQETSSQNHTDEHMMHTIKRAVRAKPLLLHYAMEIHRTTPEIIAEILLYTMPLRHTSVQPLEYNLLHRYTWTYVLAYSNDCYHHAVEYLLSRYFDRDNVFIHSLIEFSDEFNRKAIHIATPRCNAILLGRLYFFARYEISPSRPILHQSHFCLIKEALDHSTSDKQSVVLKFFKHSEKFLNELAMRKHKFTAENDYILPIIRYHNAEEDSSFRTESTKKGYGEYPYVLVMPHCDRDLGEILRHEHIVDNNDSIEMRRIASQVAKGVAYLHSEGIVHGDLKPTNILRHRRDRLKISDFHTAQTESEWILKSEVNLAYVAPEVAKVHFDAFRRVSESVATTIRRVERATSSLPLQARSSQDMWSLGCLLYLLHTGEDVFLHSVQDQLDDQQIELLYDWSDFVKVQRLMKVKDEVARHLISQLLHKDPSLRLTIQDCLKHNYFTLDTVIGRFPAMRSDFDVYVVYRSSRREGAGQWLQQPSTLLSEDIAGEDKSQSEEMKASSVLRNDSDELHFMILKRLLESHSLSVCPSLDSLLLTVDEDSLSPVDSKDLLSQYHPQSALSVLREYAAERSELMQRLILMCRSSAAVVCLSRRALGADEGEDGGGGDDDNDDFWCELLFAMQLQRMGLLERGVFLVTIGDKVESSVRIDSTAPFVDSHSDKQQPRFDMFDILHEAHQVPRPRYHLRDEVFHEPKSFEANYATSVRLTLVQKTEKLVEETPSEPSKRNDFLDYEYDAFFTQYLGDITSQSNHTIARLAEKRILNTANAFEVKRVLSALNLGYASADVSTLTYDDILFHYIHRAHTFHVLGHPATCFLDLPGFVWNCFQSMDPLRRIHTSGNRTGSRLGGMQGTVSGSAGGGRLLPSRGSRAASPFLPHSPYGGRGSAASINEDAQNITHYSDNLRMVSSSRSSRNLSLSLTHSRTPLLSPSKLSQPHINRDVEAYIQRVTTPKSRSRPPSRMQTPIVASMAPSAAQVLTFEPHLSAKSASPTYAYNAALRSPIRQPQKLLSSKSHDPFTLPPIGIEIDIEQHKSAVNTDRFAPALAESEGTEEETYPIEFYDQNIKLPYFTEIVGEDRAKTAPTLKFLTEKVEAKELHIKNLEVELQLLRESYEKRMEELKDLRYKNKILFS